MLEKQENTKIKVLLLDFSFTLCFPKNPETKEASLLDSFIINQELLDYLQTLKTNHKLYVFSAGTIFTDPAIARMLNPIFDGFISGIELKLPKSHPDTYKVIANKLNVDTNEILFIDDQQKNVEAAKTSGAQAIRFTNNAEVIESIQKIL